MLSQYLLGDADLCVGLALACGDRVRDRARVCVGEQGALPLPAR